MSPLRAIFNVVFPTTCSTCGRVLVNGEKQMCIDCLTNLSETFAALFPDNETERLLMGRIPFQAAMSLYRFKQGNTIQKAVHQMKFSSNTDLCRLMGRQMGLALITSGRFDGIDVLVPVPLHWWRRLRRGYNQSELLCRGIADVMPRPIVSHSLVRHRYTHQQSLRRGELRMQNVEKAFKVIHPEKLRDKHILLVDDVLTTGFTLTSCSDALLSVPNITISVATLCKA